MNRKGIKESKARIVFVICNTIILSAFALICLLPMLHVLFSSVSNPEWLNGHRGLVLFPHGFNLVGYKLVFQNKALIRGFMNTMMYVGLNLIFGLGLSMIGGYVLAKPDLLWKNVIMMMISFTMLFSGGIIPAYINLQNLHMVNTIWAVVLPGSLNVMNLILMREAFHSVPISLLESARLDGAGEYRILWSISLPLVKPTVATISLYLIIGMWNSWFPAAMYLRSRDLYPMQLILREILIVNTDNIISADGIAGLEENADLYKQLVKYSTIIISSLPMIILYPFIMKYFQTGIRIGAIKE